MSYVIWNGVALPGITYTSCGISISPMITTTTTTTPAAIASSATALTYPTSQPVLPVTGPGIPPRAVHCLVTPLERTAETRRLVWCRWGVSDGIDGGCCVANVSAAAAADAAMRLRYTTTTTTVTPLPHVALSGVTAVQHLGATAVCPITVQTALPVSLAWVVPK